jgi:hypothetical protein
LAVVGTLINVIERFSHMIYRQVGTESCDKARTKPGVDADN